VRQHDEFREAAGLPMGRVSETGREEPGINSSLMRSTASRETNN